MRGRVSLDLSSLAVLSKMHVVHAVERGHGSIHMSIEGILKVKVVQTRLMRIFKAYP